MDEHLFTRFHEAIGKALGELEQARNNATKADAMVLLKETLITSNMYADFMVKTKHHNRETAKVQVAE